MGSSDDRQNSQPHQRLRSRPHLRAVYLRPPSRGGFWKCLLRGASPIQAMSFNSTSFVEADCTRAQEIFRSQARNIKYRMWKVAVGICLGWVATLVFVLLLGFRRRQGKEQRERARLRHGPPDSQVR